MLQLVSLNSSRTCTYWHSTVMGAGRATSPCTIGGQIAAVDCLRFWLERALVEVKHNSIHLQAVSKAAPGRTETPSRS